MRVCRKRANETRRERLPSARRAIGRADLAHGNASSLRNYIGGSVPAPTGRPSESRRNAHVAEPLRPFAPPLRLARDLPVGKTRQNAPGIAIVGKREMHQTWSSRRRRPVVRRRYWDDELLGAEYDRAKLSTLDFSASTSVVHHSDSRRLSQSPLNTQTTNSPLGSHWGYQPMSMTTPFGRRTSAMSSLRAWRSSCKGTRPRIFAPVGKLKSIWLVSSETPGLPEPVDCDGVTMNLTSLFVPFYADVVAQTAVPDCSNCETDVHAERRNQIVVVRQKRSQSGTGQAKQCLCDSGRKFSVSKKSAGSRSNVPILRHRHSFGRLMLLQPPVLWARPTCWSLSNQGIARPLVATEYHYTLPPNHGTPPKLQRQVTYRNFDDSTFAKAKSRTRCCAD